MLVWLDLETTGLDPNKDRILEVALLVTDDNLNERAASSWVLNCPLSAPDECDAFVKKMHQENLLWSECFASRLDLNDVSALALSFLEKSLPAPTGEKIGKPILCGSSIHFDRAFINVHLPHVSKQFHYRMIDVSSINECAARWLPEIHANRPTGKGVSHRALDDIRNSLETLRYHKRHSFLAEPSAHGSRVIR